ncbi:ATP-grasp fold amidoligase family protein [Facklamia sp. P12945]|uniref:ATP-grasp fold amidoligase family protein n=1 Tax=Facklamia sp. P12945 TaxID=3421950 RepID=UPI003D1853FF
MLENYLKQVYLKNFYSNERRIRYIFEKRLGRELDLENPKRFTDKQQWLKLYWYDPLAIKCADKYLVRDYVDNKIGKKYLNEIIGVYNSTKEISFENLPNQFVLKGTHGSGFNIICKNKDKLNEKEVKKEMDLWLKKNYFWQNREWVYKDIKPRIICEKYLSEDENHNYLTDFKFFCFNGEPIYCQVIRDRGKNETIDFYDINWNHMPFNGLRELPMSGAKHHKPKKYSKMIELAKNLSGNFPFVRVDFYYIKDEIIFGELTFFPLSGAGKFTPDEWDYKLGELLVLPNRRTDKSGHS